MALPSPEEFNYCDWSGTLTTVNITSGASAASGALGTATYVVCSDVAWYFNQGTSSVTSSATTGLPLAAFEKIYMNVVSGGNDYVAGLAVSTSGKIYIKKVKS